MVSRSPRRSAQGLVGGLVGGGIGGMLFDALGNVTHGGSVSRAVGFVTIGALVGALVSLVEESGKEYWLTALNGAKEGRSFIVAREVTLFGRDEMADIPLFGDMSVGRQHARLLKQNGGMVLSAAPGLAVTVNNQPVTGAPLSSGDIIGIGSHRSRFSARRASPDTAPSLAGTEPLRSSPYAIQAEFMSAPMPGTLPPDVTGGITRLEVLAGPHVGVVFQITPGAILGRDPRCDIPLTADSQCSRQHARLVPDAPPCRIEDGGSTNGTLVNGQRIVNHVLQPGDQIVIGQTVLRVG